MKKLFLDFVFWKSPGKTHFHSVDCSISVHSVLRTPCTEKEQSTPWKWFYLTFSRKLHKKLLFPFYVRKYIYIYLFIFLSTSKISIRFELPSSVQIGRLQRTNYGLFVRWSLHYCNEVLKNQMNFNYKYLEHTVTETMSCNFKAIAYFMSRFLEI